MWFAGWVNSTAVQTLMHNFTRMCEFSGIRLLTTNHLLLSILHILLWNNYEIKMDTYLNLLISSNLRRMRNALTLLLLLSCCKLLVGWRRKTALTQRQQHLRWCRHRHDNGIASPKPGTDFLDIGKTLCWTSAIWIVSVVLSLHLLSSRLLSVSLAVVGVLDRLLLTLVITCRSATF